MHNFPFHPSYVPPLSENTLAAESYTVFFWQCVRL